MGNKKAKMYVPEAFEYFKTCMELIRRPSKDSRYTSKLKIDTEGLQEAIRALPKIDRERIEKFWGLTGGPNHSKKLPRRDSKDIAFNEMVNLAIQSLRKMFTLDYIMIYDSTVKTLIKLVESKVDKEGVIISDSEITKLLMAFFIYVENGPKMPFEEDLMSVDTELNQAFFFDEYEVLDQMCQEISTYPDRSINIRLLIAFFEMMDFEDMLAIKKSMGIEIANNFQNLLTLKEGVGIQIIRDFNSDDIEIIRTVSSIRKFKEKAFPFGAWDVTRALILNNTGEKVNLDEFLKKLDIIRKDWSKISDFKNGQKQLRVLNGIRTLDVYNIGGLEFTDIYEVMFLYSERNLIVSKN